MRSSTRVLTVAVIGMLAGCGTEDVGLPPSVGPVGECTALPLSQYCSKNPCSDYETAAANTRRHAAEATGFCAAFIGTCGGFRYTLTSRGWDPKALFFDDAGTLIAVKTSTDIIRGDDPCRGATYYGRIVDCTPEISEWPCDAR